MSYLVLARKLRPQTFGDLIGQESIAKTLKNALAKGRVAHAFLFTGPRGVGKTSSARILTKAINCLSPIDNEPCNECDNCLEINQNVCTDVLEIDAASNRGIEHIRELRDNLKFSPAKCKVKTYIIDEVHMLTTESFNALLKTLEEPPSHVKFILATTDPHKVPTTVLSRCQRYDFSLVSTERLIEYLTEIAENEGLEIDIEGIRLIAENAGGGLRDALTSMDMVISFSRGKISSEDVASILGITDFKEIQKIVEAIIAQDIEQVLQSFQSIVEKGYPLSSLLGDLLQEFKNLSIAQKVDPSSLFWRNGSSTKVNFYYSVKNSLKQDFLQKVYGVLLETEQQIRRSEFGKACFEMNLVKICSIPNLIDINRFIQSLENVKIEEVTNSQREEESPKLEKQIDDVGKVEPGIKDPVILEKSQSDDFSHAATKIESEFSEEVFEDETESNKGSKVEKNDERAPESEDGLETKLDTMSSSTNRLTVDEEENAASGQIINYSWDWFVEKLKTDLPKPMVSILRNLKTLVFDKNELVIESPNETLIELIPNERKKQLTEIARNIYGEEFKVAFKVGNESKSSSLMEQDAKIKEEKNQQKREEAVKDPLVSSVQEIFPESQIKDIIIT